MRATVNNVSLFYEKYGSGPPLLLLHGNGEDHAIFGRVGARLAQRFTIYALDSRGHGQSQLDVQVDYYLMAEDVRQFVKLTGIGPADVLGFSDGAIVAVLVALKDPGALNKMALLGVNLDPSDLTEAALKYVLEEFETGGHPLYELILTEPHIPLESLAAVKNPVLLVAGENDIIRPEILDAIAGTLPDCRQMTVKGHDHMSYISGSDLLAEDFIKFFLG
ncbi:MAG: alpha/beta hydrolase [Deltaproteobacteria bacterium]|jgi:pimeloyl-ACP methyl ester carboxylesterase|nr:alpha/beta hydrolase [Deltaproteobacteria bacterium]